MYQITQIKYFSSVSTKLELLFHQVFKTTLVNLPIDMQYLISKQTKVHKLFSI